MLFIERTLGDGLLFRHADGSAYGALQSPVAAGLRAKTHQALRRMGFREREVRQTLERIPVTAEVELAGLIRTALQAPAGPMAATSP